MINYINAFLARILIPYFPYYPYTRNGQALSLSQSMSYQEDQARFSNLFHNNDKKKSCSRRYHNLPGKRPSLKRRSLHYFSPCLFHMCDSDLSSLLMTSTMPNWFYRSHARLCFGYRLDEDFKISIAFTVFSISVSSFDNDSLKHLSNSSDI